MPAGGFLLLGEELEEPVAPCAARLLLHPPPPALGADEGPGGWTRSLSWCLPELHTALNQKDVSRLASPSAPGFVHWQE